MNRRQNFIRFTLLLLLISLDTFACKVQLTRLGYSQISDQTYQDSIDAALPFLTFLKVPPRVRLAQHRNFTLYDPIFEKILLGPTAENPDTLKPILIHEFGHYIFEYNLNSTNPHLERLLDQRMFYRNVDALSDVREISHIDLPKSGMNSGENEVIRLKQSAAKSMAGFARLTSPAEELFSDLLALCASNDGEVVKKALEREFRSTMSPKKISRRSNEKIISPEGWNYNDTHDHLAPARTYLWNKYLKGKSQAQQAKTLERIFRTAEKWVDQRHRYAETQDELIQAMKNENIPESNRIFISLFETVDAQ